MVDTAVLVACATLMGTFLWAGAMKLARADRWRKDLLAYRLPLPVRGAGYLLLPWLEIAIAAALAAGAARAGAGVALGVLLVFSLAIVRARLVTGSVKLGCGCFGSSAVRDYRLLLIRNGALAVVAGFILAFGQGRSVGAWSSSGGSGLLWWLLGGIAGLAGAWTIVHLTNWRRGRRRALVQ
jgi:hypothetical protein